VRLAILDAAHRLVELHGEAALTLSAVATEAGIARATIYGYFAGKGQLLSQLNGEAPCEPEAVMEAPDEVMPTSVVAAPGEAVPLHDDKKIEGSGDAPSARSGAPEDSADYGDMMRRQAAELDGLAKRIIVPKTVMKEGTAALLSRLETRLRVVEQSVADVETRRGRDAKELAERIGSALDAVQRLQARLENSDKRQQLTLAELRLELHNLAHRATDAGQAAERPEPMAATVSDFQPWTNAPASETAELDKVAEESAQHTYLSSARRAAIDAAQEPDAKAGTGTGERRIHWRWLLGIAVVAAAGLGFVLNMHSDVASRAHPAAQLAAYEQPAKRQAEKRNLTALAKAGNAEAQLILGLKLLNGAGVAMHIEKAAVWLERAAHGGQPVAQEILGVLYQTGTGVVADMPKAIRWYEAAAGSGNVKAMANLGKAYAGGWSEGTDITKAAQWLSRAAGFGDVDAEFDLAVLYERGEGVPHSPADAYKWYVIAAAQGDNAAATEAGIIAAQLSPDELWAAKKAATDFKPSAVNRAANDTPSLATSANSIK
jgi:TPR repeat protein